jgi:UPF0716 protein FxsA
MPKLGKYLGQAVFLSLLVVPVIEIALFVLIGRAIGFWPTVAGILLIALLGSAIIRHQGLSLLAEINGTLGRGTLPARALADAMLVGIAGVLMVVPGYFTDALGLVLLIPPLRHRLYRLAARHLGLTADSGPAPAGPASGTGGGPRTIDLDEDDFRRR